MPSRLTENQKSFAFLLHHREGRSMREIVRITGHCWQTVQRVFDAYPLEPELTPEDKAQIDSYLAMSPDEWAELRASLPSVEDMTALLDATLAALWVELGPERNSRGKFGPVR